MSGLNYVVDDLVNLRKTSGTIHFWLGTYTESYGNEKADIQCGYKGRCWLCENLGPEQHGAHRDPRATNCLNCKATQEYKEAIYELEIGFDGNYKDWKDSLKCPPK